MTGSSGRKGRRRSGRGMHTGRAYLEEDRPLSEGSGRGSSGVSGFKKSGFNDGNTRSYGSSSNPHPNGAYDGRYSASRDDVGDGSQTSGREAAPTSWIAASYDGGWGGARGGGRAVGRPVGEERRRAFEETETGTLDFAAKEAYCTAAGSNSDIPHTPVDFRIAVLEGTGMEGGTMDLPMETEDIQVLGKEEGTGTVNTEVEATEIEVLIMQIGEVAEQGKEEVMEVVILEMVLMEVEVEVGEEAEDMVITMTTTETILKKTRIQNMMRIQMKTIQKEVPRTVGAGRGEAEGTGTGIRVEGTTDREVAGGTIGEAKIGGVCFASRDGRGLLAATDPDAAQDDEGSREGAGERGRRARRPRDAPSRGKQHGRP
ncbi:Protein of unknown function, partial [Gryllus bimaculatus]